MERIFQWACDRFGPRYFWALTAVLYAVSLPVFVADAWVVLAFQGSSRYGEVAVVTLVAVLVRSYLLVLPGWPALRPIERWAAADPTPMSWRGVPTRVSIETTASQRWPAHGIR